MRDNMTEQEMLEAEKHWCENCCNFDKEGMCHDGYSTCKVTNMLTYSECCGKECKFFDVPAENVIVPPCRVGDVVYYVSDSPLNLSVQANTIYEADVSRIITTRYGTTLVIQIHNSYGCTEIPDVNDWGKTVFLTKEEAEQNLKGGSEE